MSGNYTPIPLSKNPVWLIRSAGGGVSGTGDFRITILDPRDPIEIGTYLNATPYRVRVGSGRKIVLIEFAMQLKAAANGTLMVDVEVSTTSGASWTTIFKGKPTVSGYSGLSTDFEITDLNEDNLIRYNVISAAGGGFEGILRGRITGA